MRRVYRASGCDPHAAPGTRVLGRRSLLAPAPPSRRSAPAAGPPAPPLAPPAPPTFRDRIAAPRLRGQSGAVPGGACRLGMVGFRATIFEPGDAFEVDVDAVSVGAGGLGLDPAPPTLRAGKRGRLGLGRVLVEGGRHLRDRVGEALPHLHVRGGRRSADVEAVPGVVGCVGAEPERGEGSAFPPPPDPLLGPPPKLRPCGPPCPRDATRGA